MYYFLYGYSKYRYKVFVESYRGVIKGIIGKIAYDYDLELVGLEIPTDHIYTCLCI